MRVKAHRVLQHLVFASTQVLASRVVDEVFDRSSYLRRHPTAPDVVYRGRLRSFVSSRRPRACPPPCPFLDTRVIPRELHGRALEVIRDAYPLDVGLPDDEIPIGEEIRVWDRRWIVRPSSLGLHCSLGLFAMEDIVVPDGCLPEERPELFPFHGPTYSHSHWRILSRQCPTFGRYGIKVDLRSEKAFMDGYPPRTGNLAGYINSTRGHVRDGVHPNAEWVEYFPGHHPLIAPTLTQFVITHAIRTIRAGDEILVDYEFRRS
jgi:hypothetical protein